MSYHVGNARIRASAADVAYQPWQPFEVLNGELVEAVVAPAFFRLQHLAVLDARVKVATGIDRPDFILIRIPTSVASALPPRAQQAVASCERHGRSNPSERWLSSGTATVDPRQGGGLAHYIRIDCESGFLQEHVYDINIQMNIEMV